MNAIENEPNCKEQHSQHKELYLDIKFPAIEGHELSWSIYIWKGQKEAHAIWNSQRLCGPQGVYPTICLCLQMAGAAAAKGQQNVTRTRLYRGRDQAKQDSNTPQRDAPRPCYPSTHWMVPSSLFYIISAESPENIKFHPPFQQHLKCHPPPTSPACNATWVNLHRPPSVPPSLVFGAFMWGHKLHD